MTATDRPIDLRSDTVTRPSLAMRQAMLDAEVGDDVLDGDPTTMALESRVAAVLGMEAALFFPSGVQANQAAMWLHTEPGTEVILEADSHLVHYEMSALAALAGVQIRPVTTADGVLTARASEAALRRDVWYLPRVSALAAENTHNLAGGRVMPLDVWDELVGFANDRGLPLHLDGARIWNAATAMGVSTERVVRGATSVAVSLSKGLGCPVGSCLAGRADFVKRARPVRRRLGGAMRQTGLLAAAGLYALEHHAPRLEEDHRNAATLAERLHVHPAFQVIPPETNIVLVNLVGIAADDLVRRLTKRGVLVVAMSATQVRAVTHLDVTHADVERAADAIAEALATDEED